MSTVSTKSTIRPPMAQSADQPLVSILINNYNYERFLPDAVDSALSQQYPHCETVVVDDGSTDGSQALLEAYDEQVVTVLKPNGGQASAFNAGLAASRGEIVCFLDSDDVFSAQKIARVVEIFDQNPGVGWVFHEVARVDGALQPMDMAEAVTGESGVYDLRSHLVKGKLGGAFPFRALVTSGMCFRRELLEKILPMPTDIRITSDDYIKYAALGLTPGYALLEDLASQRIHQNNAYTYSDTKPDLEPKILIQTAYFLRRDFPVIKAYANNLFALGLSRTVSGQSYDAKVETLVERYWADLSTVERIKLKAKALYYQYLRPYVWAIQGR